MDEVSAELSSIEDNPRLQERIIAERFSSSAPSTTTFTPETVHAVISVIHEKVYDIIQIEVSRKNHRRPPETQRGKRQGIL